MCIDVQMILDDKAMVIEKKASDKFRDQVYVSVFHIYVLLKKKWLRIVIEYLITKW